MAHKRKETHVSIGKKLALVSSRENKVSPSRRSLQRGAGATVEDDYVIRLCRLVMMLVALHCCGANHVSGLKEISGSLGFDLLCFRSFTTTLLKGMRNWQFGFAMLVAEHLEQRRDQCVICFKISDDGGAKMVAGYKYGGATQFITIEIASLKFSLQVRYWRFCGNPVVAEVGRSWTQERMKKGAKEESQPLLSASFNAKRQLCEDNHRLTLKRQR
ncbi:hypothetical protein V8G54_000589 [Vigna mungo]|uniref:Uncharacterized protein n=1 Tax=Vigna mungo TaxID=3915 RepID=A0AAQ3P6R4_VIGMU